jgi:two-component system, cell cycle sensor histidine kinase and response regulator CckA
MQTERHSASETPTTILVVDDAEPIRDVIKKILGNCGYTVLEAKDGETCMRVFQEHPGPIHLLITDMFMTGMNGREVADHLLASRQDIKVLFMSGHSTETILSQGGLDPAFGFIKKPFSPETLLQKVSDVLGR